MTPLLSGVSALTLAGRLGDAAAADLAAAVDRTLDGSASIVVVGQVDYLSSRALRVLEDAASRCAVRGGTVTMAVATDPVRLALEFSGSSGAFAIEATHEAPVTTSRRLAGGGSPPPSDT